MSSLELKDSVSEIQKEVAYLTEQYGSEEPLYYNDNLIETEEDLENLIHSLYNKRTVKRQFDVEMEQVMSSIKFLHQLKSLNPKEVFTNDDANFPGDVPD